MQILKKFHRRKKLEKLQKKEGKYKKSTILFNSLLPWQRPSEDKQHKYDFENVTNLAGEFREHKSRGEK